MIIKFCFIIISVQYFYWKFKKNSNKKTVSSDRLDYPLNLSGIQRPARTVKRYIFQSSFSHFYSFISLLTIIQSVHKCHGFTTIQPKTTVTTFFGKRSSIPFIVQKPHPLTNTNSNNNNNHKSNPFLLHLRAPPGSGYA